jgi:Flp pilus assembly pilin Flp
MLRSFILHCHRLRVDASGTTLIEYALIAGMISIVIFASTTLIGTSVVAMLNSAAAAFR